VSERISRKLVNNFDLLTNSNSRQSTLLVRRQANSGDFKSDSFPAEFEEFLSPGRGTAVFTIGVDTLGKGIGARLIPVFGNPIGNERL
jgi:hypothetical protein